MLAPIQARHYSISSSALAGPGEVELIVAVVSGGVSSGYLADIQRAAFKTVHQAHESGDCDAWLDAMIADGRYVEDVWAG
jgi:sulfite reductase alpha subunit-like flavoprotein